MRKSKLETAKSLAKAHFAVEPYLKCIYLLEPINEENPDDPIKLLEVVEGTIERGIEPIAFTANPAYGIDYPSLIVEVSPREYQALRKGKLDFGVHGWTIGRELLANRGRKNNAGNKPRLGKRLRETSAVRS